MIVVDPLGGPEAVLLEAALAAADGDILALRPAAAAIGDPGGPLALPFTLPTLPGGLDGLVLELQALHFRADGTTLGAPTCLVWIDSTL